MIKEMMIDALFPLRCALCDEVMEAGQRGVCRQCRSRLEYLSEPRCMKCGKELISEEEELCLDCEAKSRSYDAGFPLFNYIPPVSDSIVRLKYHGREEYADFYGREIAKRYGPVFKSLGIECIVPVPLYKARLKKRGYNQAALLGSAIASATGIRLDDSLLIRTKNTAPQKELDDGEREKNLLSAFAVKDSGTRTIPSAVLLVDDIYTTGATIEGCTTVLKRAGVRKVFYTSIAIGKV